MNFVNTLDIIGDEALTNSIIDRSITEIADSLVTNIGYSAFSRCSALITADFPAATSISMDSFYNCSALTTADFPVATNIGMEAFYRCSALITADFPAATSIGQSAFSRCSALITADFPAATSIGPSAFSECSKLTALILRSETMCTLSNANAFISTPIISGTGYIYVPAALVDSYKANSTWSTLANQFRAIEDYPEICNPYSWEAVSHHLDAGDYATFYSVGDVIPLDLGSEGVVNMQIAAFNKDDLADGSGKASISFVAQNPLVTSRRMNPALVTGTLGTGALGGWDNSEMKDYLSNTLKPAIPEAVRSRIQAVTKTQPSYNASGYYEHQTSTDEVWIPSNEELYDEGGLYTELYPDNASKIKSGEWWMRTASNSERFRYVGTNGDWNNGYAQDLRGVIIGFCIN